MAALTTIARVEIVRPPSKGGRFADDPILEARATACLNAASSWFTNAVGRDITSAAKNYLLSGRGNKVLSLLGDWPIAAVASAVVENVAWTQLSFGAQYAAQDYIIHPSGRYLLAMARPWPLGVGNIQVVATVGFSPIPDDVQQCVAMLTWLLLEETNRLGIASSTLGAERIGQLARNSKDYDFMQTTIEYYGRVF